MQEHQEHQGWAQGERAGGQGQCVPPLEKKNQSPSQARAQVEFLEQQLPQAC